MILCVGEILADLIGGYKDGSYFYERKAGGAPFNVACASKKFGADVTFAGSVGNDIIGNYLIDFAKKYNLNGYYIKRINDRNTTLAFVELDKNGERSFCFNRERTADYYLPQLDKEYIANANIVHIGSLMLSKPIGRKYAFSLANKARKHKKLVSFDVNFRSDIFESEEQAKLYCLKMIELADVVKLSEDEISLFDSRLIEKFMDKLICITLGSKGSKWLYNSRSNVVPTISVKPVDTTGAGDAFYAGVLSKLDRVNRNDWTDEFLNATFRFANICGGLNTLGKGAIDFLPTLEEINKFL